MKINKNPPVNNGVELHPSRFELQIWLSRLPWALEILQKSVTQKPDIQMQTFLTCDLKKKN